MPDVLASTLSGNELRASMANTYRPQCRWASAVMPMAKRRSTIVETRTQAQVIAIMPLQLASAIASILSPILPMSIGRSADGD
jgi:hypothetical protein